MKEGTPVRMSKSRSTRYYEKIVSTGLTTVIVSFHNSFCGQCSTLLASSSRPRAMDLQDDWKILEQTSSGEQRSGEQRSGEKR